MGRRPSRVPLNVFLNDRHVGVLTKAANGAIEFAYDRDWLVWEHALPISLSLPLRENRYIGAAVSAVFENLLPDFEPIRMRIAERVGASGTDAFSLLAQIGRDCVGALQFLPLDEQPTPTTEILGSPIDDDEIVALLANLGRTPLGLDADIDDAFRISIAGAQEKTALLHHEGRWHRPHGTTPTTHILKPQIGRLPMGIDLSDSVENEFYCLKLMEAFGFATARCEIETFGDNKVLIVERFDRRRTRDNRLIRLPQEDCCQALSLPPTRKCQNQGGPGIASIMGLLKASDDPIADRLTFFRSHLLFWLIGATDGHAKNFSVFLRPGGRFSLTPFYDVLSAQPTFDAGHIGRNAFKLSMSVGASGKYRIGEIHGRHFVETGEACGLSFAQIAQAIDEIRDRCDYAFDQVQPQLPDNFPAVIPDSIAAAARTRLASLDTARN